MGREPQVLRLTGRVCFLCSVKPLLNTSLLFLLADVGLSGSAVNQAVWAGMGTMSLFTMWY